MGLPKIPDAKEIADMTALAMEPMMAKLDLIHTALTRLVEIEEARVAYDEAVRGASHGAAMRVVR